MIFTLALNLEKHAVETWQWIFEAFGNDKVKHVKAKVYNVWKTNELRNLFEVATQQVNLKKRGKSVNSFTLEEKKTLSGKVSKLTILVHDCHASLLYNKWLLDLNTKCF